MKAIRFLIFFLLAEFALAGEFPIKREIPSTNHRFVAVVTQNEQRTSPTIEIRTSDGRSIFTLKTEVLGLECESAIWSPDGEVLAIAADTGKSGFTYLFVRKGDTFATVSGPEIPPGYDNLRIRPNRWIKGKRLILDITGPHAGKADGYSFKGKSTIRVSPESRSCEVLYQHITGHSAKE